MRPLLAGLALIGCAAGPVRAETTNLNYWMWDPDQEPEYQACVKNFETKFPDIHVAITQIGWDDYWARLTTALVSGTAPDVFADHLAHYPELLENQQIMDIAPLITRDHVDTSIYIPGLVTPWIRDGKQYGLPKDWDTIGFAYNDRLLRQAGIDPSSLSGLTWNPKDGGTYGAMLAKLTVDTSGRSATQPGFDAKSVKQYGIVIDGTTLDAFGQTSWASFAVSDGFRYDQGPWATSYFYNDPKLAATLQWMADLGLERGIAVPQNQTGHGAGQGIFAAGRAATFITGSWLAHWLKNNSRDPIGFAPMPIGPDGRKSMFNGLADSIYARTAHKEQAWQLLRFLASPQCEDAVGDAGVIFPAIPAATKASEAKMAMGGIDVSAFVSEAKPGIAFPFPVTDHVSEIQSTMKSTMDDIFLGRSKAAPALKQANDAVNALFN